jgi:hypothetical protein
MARYDRYNKFRRDGQILHVPYIEIPIKSTDYYTYYEAGKTRLDLLSYQYYGDANYDWLILQANPEIGSLEFKIETGTKIRIPYPLDTTIARYNSDIDTYEKLYGLDVKE